MGIWKGQLQYMHVEARYITSCPSVINFIIELYEYPSWKTNGLYQWKSFSFYFYQS